MLKATQETYPRCVCDLITIADTLVLPEERHAELVESCLCEEGITYEIRVEGDVHVNVTAPECVFILFGSPPSRMADCATGQAQTWCKSRFLTAVRCRNTLRRLLREQRLPIGKTLTMPWQFVRGTVRLTRTA